MTDSPRAVDVLEPSGAALHSRVTQRRWDFAPCQTDHEFIRFTAGGESIAIRCRNCGRDMTEALLSPRIVEPSR